MKRRLFKLGLLLLAGAIVNVAVAWGCVLCAGNPRTESLAIPKPSYFEDSDDHSWVEINRRCAIGCIEQDGGFGFKPVQEDLQAQTVERAPAMWCGVGGRPPNEILPMAAAPWTRLGISVYRGERIYIASEIAAGFPMLSFWGVVAAYRDGPAAVHLATWGIGPSRKGRFGTFSPPDKCLPFDPLWPGFAINTIFYAAILWGMFAVPLALRRRRRVKRGLCPACAYPVGTSPMCTECGSSLQGSTFMKRLIAPIVLVMVTLHMTGCVTLYRYRDVTFKVVDAETDGPVEGANLQVWYNGMFEIHRPKSVEVVTPANGIVTVRAANFHGEFGLIVAADNYLGGGGRATIRERAEHDQFRLVVLPDGVINTIPLFAKPRPMGTIILPQGFQGLLRYPRKSQSDIEPQPGQREFTIHVANDGIVHLPVVGVTRYAEWETRDADGALIPKVDTLTKETPPEIARYWIGVSDFGLLEYVGDDATARAAFIFVNQVTFPKEGGAHMEGDPDRANQVWEKGLSAVPQPLDGR